MVCYRATAKYKSIFQTRKVIILIIILAILSFLATMKSFWENHAGIKMGKRYCFYESLITPKAAENAVNIVYCFLTVFLPLIFITGAHHQLRKIMKNQTNAAQSRVTNTRRHLEIRLLRMSIFVALCIGICFVPNQISYILAMTLDSYPYESPVHFTTVVLSMLNSCINPWIYCLTNKLYRREFAILLCPCKKNQVDSSGGTNPGEI